MARGAESKGLFGSMKQLPFYYFMRPLYIEIAVVLE
jgi:hypothetical protein